MKYFGNFLILMFISVSAFAANEVSEERMQQVYKEIMTPYKYGLVLAPDRNDYKMDCPTVFREGKMWYMTYLVYNGKGGNDGRGYETWLAESPDLLKWKTLGRILSFKDKGWDNNQRGGYMALIDNEWGGSYKVQKFKGKYWLTYIGGDTPGYELGVLKIGVANTKDLVSKAHEWTTFDKPVLAPSDSDAGWWEKITQYKSSVMWDKTQKLGYPFVMFYNAAGNNPQTNIKGERIGIALSKDMINWKRYTGSPVINHEGGITGDAVIQKMGDLYVLFYFSAFRPNVPHKAFNSFCCSYDLIHWTDWKGEKLIYPSEKYDNLFAHKSCVVKHNGVVYHFYCAVDKDNQRGIALATSKPMGRSSVRFPEPDKISFRKEISLSRNWESCLGDSIWKKVNVPHNWDQYYGYRMTKHGNLHGSAWYRKYFETPAAITGKCLFLYFEGVGSYATVYVNGIQVGSHKGGRTTFTLDITKAIKTNGQNLLIVKADHPSMISDLPWVCGGCSGEIGFSEGPQPLGIFRPVTLVVTDEVRVQPFGVHLWNEKGSIRKDGTSIQVETTIKNYGDKIRNIELVSKLVDEDDISASRTMQTIEIKAGEEIIVRHVAEMKKAPKLWSLDNPVLYYMVTMLKENGKVIDEIRTPYGLRTISWPQSRNDGDNRFFVGDKPVFINGTCEYEHLNGISQAFSEEQINSRVEQIRAAGFNAFRDAHQPHNLLYNKRWDELGMLCWTQFSAHIWYDTPAFRDNFKTLLKEWVIERRNSPSIILWGLQNESALPKDFAKECCELIRQLDPTTSSQRLITTCNGGVGTDWDVIQNWSGTYSGDPAAYGKELSKQLLNGEYGAWRSIDLHTEGGFVRNGVQSEDRMCLLLEQKIRLAEQNRDSLCGHFIWPFNSHENPGRTQNNEGFREIDRIGPFNYKGLTTPWGEPLDAFYLYRSNYAPKETEPMLYIVSHTWPDRWTKPGIKDSIIVYSNCDSVELFNDMNDISLGMRIKFGKGSHFQWDKVNIKFNVLYAVGYTNGRPAAKDCIVLNYLPKAPHFNDLHTTALFAENISGNFICLEAQKGYNYLYRVNCGGPDYTDRHKQNWQADRALTDTISQCWGSLSWTNDFKGLHPYLASQRSTNDPIAETADWKLFQTFRYGTDKLKYRFPVKPGEYLVELYFIEPWYGTGGGLNCDNWRKFDVAVNGKNLINGLDIWREAGHDAALKKSFNVKITGNILELSFPEIYSGQAVISAIAIATKDKTVNAAEPAKGLSMPFSKNEKISYWLNNGDRQFAQDSVLFSKLPPVLYGAEWIQQKTRNGSQSCTLKILQDAVVYLAVLEKVVIPAGFESTSLSLENSGNEIYHIYSKKFPKDSKMDIVLPGPYTVAIVPDIKPIQEEDLRPNVSYEAEDAGIAGEVVKVPMLGNKTYVAIEKVGKVSFEWDVTPGLAGIYNIRFRYKNVIDKPLSFRIQIISSDNLVLKNGMITFPTASDKWRVISTSTEAFINAGHYKIRLESDNAVGFWIDSIDFQ